MKIITKIKFQILFLLVLSSLNIFSQEIAINEVMTSNTTAIADEDGSFEDWIEIYNYGSTSVNLSGYGLSDEVGIPFKWVFPAVTIPAKGFLLIWASDKNKTVINQPLHTNFKLKSGGEAVFLTKPGGVLVSEVPAIALAEDTSYGRSPDGTGSWNVFTTSTPNKSNTGTIIALEEIAINEIMISNLSKLADEDGDFSDWIEIYNYGTTPVNLSGFGLSDDTTLPYKWVFPSITIAPNQYILVWASDKNRAIVGKPLHTNFKINAGGETLNLTNKSGKLISGSPSVAIDSDVSYGRQPDGTGSWFFFTNPTPLSSNISTGITSLPKSPKFSHDSGLYSGSFNLTLSTENTNSIIVYTTDGSEPDINNLSGTTFTYKNDYPFNIGESFGPLLNETFITKQYSSPITIVDRSNDPDRLANKNTVQDDLYTPPNPVRKATVIKARSYLNGVGSKTIAKTFFVWNGINPYNTPIISMQLNEESLFGYQDGIYTAGIDFDTWRTNNPTGPQPGRADWNNYARSGREWEKPVHVEIFDSKLKSVANLNAGLRIHGNTSLSLIIKSLRLYARSDYDEKDVFEFDPFDQKIPGAIKPYNDNFKRLLLRGNGSGGYIANDVVFHRLMQPFWNGVARIKTAVHFFNGEFWGITAIRDRFDSHHFANNFDLDSDNIAVLDCKAGNCILDEGDSSDFISYQNLVSLINNNDLKVASNYNQVVDRLDIDSYINHLMMEIFAEGDSYELKYWKTKTKVNDNFGDGKWRVTTHDFENGLNNRTNWLANFADKTGISNRPLLGKLLDNDIFKVKFINRFADLLNTGFKKERFDAIVNETFNEINPILPEDRNRAPRLRFYSNSDRTRLLDWIKLRPTRLRDQIKALFNIENTIDLNLKITNINAGYVKVNTVDINSLTPGVDLNTYPWQGVYFKGIPITLEAKERPGYLFSHWSGGASGTNKTITITPTDNIEITANYELIQNFSHLAYFWLIDEKVQNDTPLQKINNTYSRYGLSAEVVYTSSLEGYPFTSSHPNWRKASLERRNSPTPINYDPSANKDIPFATQMMRGLQIKQPFKSGSLENTLQVNVPTTNYKDIKLSFAISSDGASQSINVDYWNGTSWSNQGISYNPAITVDYERKEIDFTNVEFANNNENFKIRIRFEGANMTADEGKVVLLNNISVNGIGNSILSSETFTQSQDLKVFPNPTTNNLKIQGTQTIDKVALYNVFGKLVYIKNVNSTNLDVDMKHLASGVYLLKVFSNQTSINKKIIKL